MITNHQTNECSLPDCFCHEAQRLEPSRAATIVTPRFEQAWDSLPRDIRRVTEREAGGLIYRLGVRDGRLLEQVETNRVMRQMAGKLEEIR